VWDSPSSPGSPRPVPGAGPSYFRRKPLLYPAELRAQSIDLSAREYTGEGSEERLCPVFEGLGVAARGAVEPDGLEFSIFDPCPRSPGVPSADARGDVRFVAEVDHARCPRGRRGIARDESDRGIEEQGRFGGPSHLVEADMGARRIERIRVAFRAGVARGVHRIAPCDRLGVREIG